MIAPIAGARKKTQTWLRAWPPTSSAGPKLRAGLTDTPVTCMPTMWMTARVMLVFDDGTAHVATFGGGEARVRNPLGIEVGQPVYVQDSAVIGEAPELLEVLIEL